MTVSNADITVVVPNWNGRELLLRCLDALAGQTVPARLIVVDNGSTDGSVDAVRERHPDVDVVELAANVGFAAAANAGAARAETTYVAFLNNDTEPEPAWLESLVRCLEGAPGAASAASCVVSLADPRIIDGAGDSMTRSLKAYRRGQGEPARGRYTREEEVFSASGTACLWRLGVFGALGGFDESFFAYYEDVDLGFRARLAGYGCRYVPTAVVRHHGSAAAAAEWRTFRGYHAVANRWAMIVKDAPRGLLLRERSRVQRSRARGPCDYRIDARRFPPLAASLRGLLSPDRTDGVAGV